MTAYRFTAQNVGDLDRPRAVGMITDYIGEVEPDLAQFSEADGFGPLLRRLGYRSRIARTTAGTFILVAVREDHRIVGTSTMRMHVGWRGPKRATIRPPRQYPLVTWETSQGDLHDTIGVHLPFDGPRGVNGQAWCESADRLTARWDHRAGLPRKRHLSMLGDFNGRRAELEAHLDVHGGHLLPDNLLVDHMFASNSLAFDHGRRLADTPAHPPYLWVVKAA